MFCFGVQHGLGSTCRDGGKPRPYVIFVLALLVGALCSPAGAKGLAVTTDGKFDEWGRRKPRISDPRGDGAEGGVDLGRLWLADDGEALYLRLELGRETLIQEPIGSVGNVLRLYLDADGRKNTGAAKGSLGVELEIRFGERSVFTYDEGGAATRVSPGSGIFQALPTHSSEEFEIRIPLPVRPPAAESTAGKRRKVKLMLREETAGGDRLPDRGVVVYRLAKKSVPAPKPIELDRAGELRIVSINVEDGRLDRVPEVYIRFFELVQPDVVCLQSLRDWSTQEALGFVADVLPGKRWSSARVDDIHTISSFPILDAEAIDNNLAAHLQLPGSFGGRDLVLFNIHPPCCENDAGRDAEVDNLMKAWRDLLAGSGPFPIDPDDAMVIAGDFNLVGFERQLITLRDGVFVDPANGPDFAPGRDQGSLREASLRHTHRRLVHTWRREGSAFAPGRLDFVLYTGDALEHLKSFVPDTEGMPEDFLETHGLEASDSLQMSDHLPLVVDFEVRDR